MIARVAVDEHVIREPAIGGPKGCRAACANLGRLLRAHGVLVSELDRRRLAGAAKQLDDVDLRTLWLNLLDAVPFRQAVPAPSSIESLDSFAAVCREWQAHSEVAVARDGYLEGLDGRSDDDYCRDEASGFELVAYQALHVSRLARLAESAVMSLPAGTDREAIWAEWLGPLARFANQVTIVDRYCAKEEYERGGRADTGLRWLLSKLNEQADIKLRVTLFTAYGKGAGTKRLSIGDARTAIERARGSLAQGRIGEATLWLVEDGHFCHDRWLRFRLGDGRGRHHRLMLGRGLKAFETTMLGESLNIAYCVDRIPVDEQEMRQSVLADQRGALSLPAPPSTRQTAPPLPAPASA